MSDFGILSAIGLALQPTNLLSCFIGAVVGTLVGVLPGLGPAAAMALALPLTFKLGPTAGLIMLAGIYYGSMYGGFNHLHSRERPRRARQCGDEP